MTNPDKKKTKKKDQEFKKRFENEIKVCSADSFLEELADKYSEKESKEDKQ